MDKSKTIAALLALLFFQACKVTQPARPSEYYDSTEEMPFESTIYVPLNIYKAELEKSINSQLGEVLFEDSDIADDGLMLKATRREDIRISMDSQVISYAVPIDLWIKKDLNIARVVAEGSLELNFQTVYQIIPDWSLTTKTELTNYKWIEEPTINLGFANLPITSIADSFLEKSKAQIATAIDEQVAGFLDLRSQMESIWRELHEPVLVSDEYAAWLLLNPKSIGMTPLKTSESLVQSTVVIHSSPTISLGKKPTPEAAGAMPDFRYSSGEGDEFLVKIRTEIPFAEAERISKETMAGEVFDYGKKKVVVEDVEIYGQGNRLVVNTKLSGDYNGNVYFTGKPKYNGRKNQIELEKVDFDFDSKKALLRTASWLFKGAFKKRVQESLNYYLTYNLEDTQNFIRQELKDYPLAPGIRLTGDLYELNVSHVYIANKAIRVEIGLQGRLNVEVKSLGF